MKLLLTSAGLETDTLQRFFLQLLPVPASEIRALFLPTAAIDPEAIAVLPKCMDDLLKCGILPEHITVFDLHTGMPPEQLQEFHVVYLCGGSPEYLLQRIRETGFTDSLTAYLRGDGVVIGVSAGSVLFADNLEGNLGFVDTVLEVHCAEGDVPGPVSSPPPPCLQLTNTRALMVWTPNRSMEIVGDSASV